MTAVDMTPCPICHRLTIKGGVRVPCGCVDLSRLRSGVQPRFFPRNVQKRNVTEITRPQFEKVAGTCHHKKSDVAETTAQFKKEGGACVRDFGGCWRRVRHPDGEVAA